MPGLSLALALALENVAIDLYDPGFPRLALSASLAARARLALALTGMAGPEPGWPSLAMADFRWA